MWNGSASAVMIQVAVVCPCVRVCAHVSQRRQCSHYTGGIYTRSRGATSHVLLGKQAPAHAAMSIVQRPASLCMQPQIPLTSSYLSKKTGVKICVLN